MLVRAILGILLPETAAELGASILWQSSSRLQLQLFGTTKDDKKDPKLACQAQVTVVTKESGHYV
jgi:hypothetical protein